MAKFGDRVKIVDGKYKDLIGILKRPTNNQDQVEIELELNGLTIKIPVGSLRKLKETENELRGKPRKQDLEL